VLSEALRLVRSVEALAGLALEAPADVREVVWLSNEVPTRRTSPGCGSKEVRTRNRVRNQECPPRSSHHRQIRREIVNVIIGVDPHKTSHTAVALDGKEAELGKIKVRANSTQLKRLLAWAAPFDERTWAVEGAGGCGYLLSQQLVAAGETVLNVPATLAARVRVLGTGRSNKNDPNDARSVAIAALRAPGLAAVRPADHASVLRLLAKRHTQLTSSRTRTACRLHALLTDLIPGGSAPKLKAKRAQQVLDAMVLSTPVEHARHDLAREHLEDLRRLDAQIVESKKRIADAVTASGTTLDRPRRCRFDRRGDGDRPHRRRAPLREAGTTTPPTTAPRRSRCPPVIGRSIGSHAAGTVSSTTPCILPRSPRSATPAPRDACTTTARSPRARPRRTRSAR